MTELDTALLLWLRAYHAPWLDWLMSAVTVAGIMAGIWHLVALLSLFVADRRAAAWRALLALWLGLAMVDLVLKPVIDRPRPAMALDSATRLQWANDAEERGLVKSSNTSSMPSGHATSAFAGAIMISQIWPRARAVWWTLAVLIAFSRVYLGHHYPSDVAAGALLGTAVAVWVLGGWPRWRPSIA